MSNQVPEKLFWVKGAAHDVRVYDEDVEYISLSYHETELERVRRETWDAAIALVRSFEFGTEIRKTKGFKFKLPYTKEVAHVIVKELEFVARSKRAALEAAREAKG